GLAAVKGNLTDHHFTPTNNKFTIPATILFSQDSLHLSALNDSGSEQNAIDQRLVEQAQINTERLPFPHLVSAIVGKNLQPTQHTQDHASRISNFKQSSRTDILLRVSCFSESPSVRLSLAPETQSTP
ncbi:hypothetical protein ILYODFUR_012812, partial [Ilyodon furcidens]